MYTENTCFLNLFFLWNVAAFIRNDLSVHIIIFKNYDNHAVYCNFHFMPTLTSNNKQ